MSGRNPDYEIRARDVPRRLFPTGRVRFSIGTAKKKLVELRRAQLNVLREKRAWDILKAIQDGVLHIGTVCDQLGENGTAAIEEIRHDLNKCEREPTDAPPSASEQGLLIPNFRVEIDSYLEAFRGRVGAKTKDAVTVRSLITRESELARLKEVNVPSVASGRQEVVALGDLRMDEVASGDIKSALAPYSHSANTYENLRVAASAVFTWSIEQEAERARVTRTAPRWTSNPASLVPAGEREIRVGTVSYEDVRKLFAVAEPYQEAYLRCFLHLGMRLGEFVHTRLIHDLDLTTWDWRIGARLPDPRCPCPACQGSGWKPKTERSDRVLHVPDSPRSLRRAIQRYLALHPPAVADDFAFRNPRTGDVWRQRTLEEDFKRLCERAGVLYGRDRENGIVLHTLRHTCATNLVLHGVRESIIADLLGDTVETVVKYYVNLRPENLGSAVREGPAYD